MRANYTYQIAINESGNWLREYVCAESKYQAVTQFLEEFPSYTLDYLLLADQFEVERCD